MKFFNRKKENENNINIVSPIKGDVLPIEQTPDQLFAGKALGDGVVIKPKHGSLYSPCHGVVEVLFPTKHAIGIRLDNGASLFIHFGLETVRLNGQGFETFVKQGQRIKKGKLLLEVYLDYIRENAADDCVILAISELKDNFTINKNYGVHEVGDDIITIKGK